MRRVSKRPKVEKVRTFYEEDLYTLSFHGADDAPHLCIEVNEEFERCISIDYKWDTFYIVRVKRLDNGHDIIEATVPSSTPVDVASVYLAGYEMSDPEPMLVIMDEINSYDSDDETKSDIKNFFEEVKLYLKEHEE